MLSSGLDSMLESKNQGKDNCPCRNGLDVSKKIKELEDEIEELKAKSIKDTNFYEEALQKRFD